MMMMIFKDPGMVFYCVWGQ